ncbi:MAG: hypothetical protein ACRDD8_12055, partial [Bacteroidales bacterium]
MSSKRGSKYIYIIIFLFCFYLVEAGYASYSHAKISQNQNPVKPKVKEKDSDTLKYRIRKTVPENPQDINQSGPVDLLIPENIHTAFEFNPVSNTYIYRSKIGDTELGIPFSLTREEYMKYHMENMMRTFYRKKISENYPESENTRTFNPFD